MSTTITASDAAGATATTVAGPAVGVSAGSAAGAAPGLDGLDPRTRVLAAAALVIVAAALDSLAALGLALAAAMALAAASRQPLAGLGRRLLHIEGFLLVLLVLLPLTTPGTPLVALGPLAASHEGLMLAVTLALRIAACATIVFALLGNLEPLRLGAALGRLGLPARLVHLLLFLCRYSTVFRTEARRLSEAMRTRGFIGRPGLHSLRSYGNLAGMLLVRALDRAERVDQAMRCRGFSGHLPLPAGPGWTRQDLRFGIGLALAGSLVLVVDGLMG